MTRFFSLSSAFCSSRLARAVSSWAAVASFCAFWATFSFSSARRLAPSASTALALAVRRGFGVERAGVGGVALLDQVLLGLVELDVDDFLLLGDHLGRLLGDLGLALGGLARRVGLDLLLVALLGDLAGGDRLGLLVL